MQNLFIKWQIEEEGERIRPSEKSNYFKVPMVTILTLDYHNKYTKLVTIGRSGYSLCVNYVIYMLFCNEIRGMCNFSINLQSP